MSNEKGASGDEESLQHAETTSLNLNSNVEARIKNPLAGIPRSQLLRNVEIFAQEKGLSEEIPTLSKGAICTLPLIGIILALTRLTQTVAQNPADFETLDVLDDSDRDIIRYENAHRWSHPFTLYMTIVLCSVGAATQLVAVLVLTMYTAKYMSKEAGIKQVRTELVSCTKVQFPIVIDVVKDLSFPTEFGIPNDAGAPNAAHNSWIVGIVNAAPYLASAVWYAFTLIRLRLV
jgi:hypothetical protein